MMPQAPKLTVDRYGCRCRVEVEEDLVGQTRVLLAQPLFERNRFAIIGAGVAEE